MPQMLAAPSIRLKNYSALTLERKQKLLFEKIIAQEIVKKSLKNALKAGTLPHAYIFAGPEGVGKRSVAEILARVVNCEQEILGFCGRCQNCQSIEKNIHPDVEIIEEEEIIKIDLIRKLKEKIGLKPILGRKKVYLLLNADRMNEEAQNCFLKTLEEPAGETLLILTTHNLNLLLPTIVSRAAVLLFKPLPQEQVEKFLQEKYHLPPTKAHQLATFRMGNLKKIIAEIENEEKVAEGKESEAYISQLISADENDFLARIEKICENKATRKEKATLLLDFALWWFRDLLFLKLQVPDKYLANVERKNILQKNVHLLSLEALVELINSILWTKEEIKVNVNLKLLLEVLFLKIRSYKLCWR